VSTKSKKQEVIKYATNRTKEYMKTLSLVFCLATSTIYAHPLISRRQPIEGNDQFMDLTGKKCKACEGGVDPLSVQQENEFLSQVPQWTIDREDIHKITAEFTWKDFVQAMNFVNIVACIAEEEGHHPNIGIVYNKVILELYTHAIKGLSENDFIVAAKIDKAVEELKPA
jgi:4a-hydroxytetrahydrobiopterin dehydratase